MTRLRPLLAGVALVGTTLLLLSCSKAPTAPGVSPVTRTPGAQMSTASQTWTRASAAVDETAYCECLGEYVHFLGEYAYQYHFVESGSGSVHTFFQAVPVTPKTGAPLSVHGETSGKVFVIAASPVTEKSNSGSRIQVLTIVERETYVAADGSKLLVTSRLHLTADGTGHLIVEKVEPWSIECVR